MTKNEYKMFIKSHNSLHCDRETRQSRSRGTKLAAKAKHQILLNVPSAKQQNRGTKIIEIRPYSVRTREKVQHVH